MKLDEPQTRPLVEQILSRPPAERAREFKYRTAQSLVFGLPVLALHWLGPLLGGPESSRWTGLFQMLLAGWILYVAAAGMMSEGLLLLVRGRLTADLFVALLATVLYLISVVAWAALLAAHVFVRLPMLFPHAVLLLIGWCAARYGWLSATARGGRR